MKTPSQSWSFHMCVCVCVCARARAQQKGKQQTRFGACIYYLQPVASKTQGVGCDTFRFGRYKPLWGTDCFHLNSVYSTLKMDIAWSSEVAVSFFPTTRRHTPKTVVSTGTAVGTIGVLISPQPDQECNKLQRPNSNICKPLKKIQKLVRTTGSPRQQ